jgi:beta-lactamase regulating signal transducer with metallopeptidase domain
MTGWLLETLVWTAVLIAAVLVLRRPVARWFGPQFAYALWAIPVLRLILPPLELPAWANPSPAEPPLPAASEADTVVLDPTAPVATFAEPVGYEAAASDVSASLDPASGFEIGPFLDVAMDLAFAVWIIGAAVFLYLRFSAYFRLRAELLDGACELGREGKVRLVETSGTDAPLAFGVIDKVVALPHGFLAQADRQARDLALAHELAHHRGRDLLVNVLVQPLFAMHWFNPLARFGWLALRRDQEAACDARVMAAKTPEERPETREAYANLIVAFAAGPNAALGNGLTAPMACPVLGEKSIVHRLRSLKMTDTPKSRRLAGRVLLGAAVVALPLTATISYAASDAPLAPVAPLAPAAPAASAAPAAPVAPAPLAQETIVEVDPDSEVAESETINENVFVIRTDDGEGEVQERRWVVRNSGDAKMSDKEMEEVMIEVRRGLAEANAEIDNLPHVIEMAMAEARTARDEAGRHMVVEMSCDGNEGDVSTTVDRADGTQVVKICRRVVMADALEGLREAREEIANDRELTGEIRAEILRELDKQIERMGRSSR